MHEGLKSIFERVLNLPPDKIDETISMKTCKKWDSLAHINLMLSIEDHVGASFSPDELQEMVSYELIVEVLRKKGVLNG